jgi:hypothetical protein
VLTYEAASGGIVLKAGGGGGASSLNGLSDVLIDGTSNYFVNIPAGLSGSPANNLVIGNNTGNSLTSGFSNILLGASAGASITSGEENVIIGDTAGDALVLTDRNTIIGNNAASEVTSCQHLLALGNNAARNMTSNSSYNIALGEDTNTITSGSGRNICIGHRVLRTASSAQFNTCVGVFAGTAMSTGSNNALFGYYAGIAARGDNNVLLGYEAGATGTNDLTTGDNNVVIGAGSEVSAATVSNEVNIYNGSVTARFQGAAAAWSFVSDARDKKDVEDLELGLDFVTKLKPRKFKWDLRNSNVDKNKEASGFIAQEVKEVLDEIENDYTGIVDTNNPDQYTVSQANIIPMLVNAIKELKQEINDLKCKTCQ